MTSAKKKIDHTFSIEKKKRRHALEHAKRKLGRIALFQFTQFFKGGGLFLFTASKQNYEYLGTGWINRFEAPLISNSPRPRSQGQLFTMESNIISREIPHQMMKSSDGKKYTQHTEGLL